jgi:hypothetical protein
MPLGKGVRYRVKTAGGKKIRLAFKGNRVVEAKNLESGATHTPKEFEADRTRKKRVRKAQTRMGNKTWY